MQINMWQAIVSLGILGFFWWLIQKVISSGKQEAHLQAKIDLLEEKVSNLENEKTSLQKENDNLKELTSKKPLKRHNSLPCYVNENNLPVCSPCYEKDSKVITLKPCADPSYGWQCPVCNNLAKNPNYRPPEQEHPHSYDPFKY